MQDQKVLQRRLKHILSMFCFFMAVYMILILLERYVENRDATTVAYKKYNEREIDKYPTFSFCFSGENFHWYNDHNIFDAYELNATQFESMLKGQDSRKYEFDQTSQTYKRQEVLMDERKHKFFEKFHLQISDILSNEKFATESSEDYSNHDDRTSGMGNATKMFVNYQNAETICFTRSSNDSLDLVRIYDMLSFNRSILFLYPNTMLDIYIHYPGQLIKVFDNPSFSSAFHDTGFAPTDLTSNSLLEFRIFQQTILRKRPNSKVGCNDQIENHDEDLKLAAIRKIGCVPIYLKHSLPEEANIAECKSKEDMKKAFKIIKSFKRIIDSTDKPCVEMFVASSYGWIPQKKFDPSYPENLKEVAVRFLYRDKYYQEIEYVRDFGFESFMSGVGGFVGIFLGYSLRQIPELIIGFVALIGKLRKPGSKDKNYERRPGKRRRNSSKH